VHSNPSFGESGAVTNTLSTVLGVREVLEHTRALPITAARFLFFSGFQSARLQKKGGTVLADGKKNAAREPAALSKQPLRTEKPLLTNEPLLTKAEQKVIAILREVQYGEVKVVVQDGVPVRVEEIRKSIKI